MDFLDDLEEDPQLRQHVNVYHDPVKQAALNTAPPVTDEDDVEPDAPTISLEEMLDELNIEEKEEEDLDEDNWEDAQEEVPMED